MTEKTMSIETIRKLIKFHADTAKDKLYAAKALKDDHRIEVYAEVFNSLAFLMSDIADECLTAMFDDMAIDYIIKQAQVGDMPLIETKRMPKLKPEKMEQAYGSTKRENRNT